MAYFPAKHWESEADKWDATVANQRFPHYFYYYEADLYIADLLEGSQFALELGAGTCGSTVKHASKDRRIVAIDYSRRMLEAGRNKLRTAGLSDFVDIVVADVCNLPFRELSFDKVFSRGVALSYARDPERFAGEACRVLQRNGRLGIDFMNRISADKVERKICGFERINGQLYYVEMFNENGRQKRIGYMVPKEMIDSQRTESSSFGGFESKPEWLKLDGLAREEWWAVFYAPAEARRLLRSSGLREIKLYPLGCFTRGIRNPALNRFLIDNRDQIARVQKELAQIFSLDQAIHIFMTAVKKP
ncbi:MAG TPA: class I SAM-dependent methyltransferase [Candidatus Bathyarchaeia archaeon]|nr:class I SAM-dependent methyltransferase [Candidatus Bathyarchaeia archaeon]